MTRRETGPGDLTPRQSHSRSFSIALSMETWNEAGKLCISIETQDYKSSKRGMEKRSG